MAKFSERFKQLRTERGLSQQDMANQLGFTKSRVNMYERGEREPGFDALETIADYFNVDMDFLLGKSDIPNRSAWEEGELFDNSASSDYERNVDAIDIGKRIEARRHELGLTLAEIASQIGVATSTIQRYEAGEILRIKIPVIFAIASVLKVTPQWLLGIPNSEKDAANLDFDNILPLPNMRKVPLLGTIACGTPILAAENLDGYVKMPENVHADFCLRCKGDSMIGARIMDGDLVFIHQQPDVDNGAIAAVIVEDEATLKRIYKSTGKIILQPENPRYEPFVFVGEELSQIRIIGKAVAFLSGVE